MHDTTRRHALECMLWAGGGVLWTMAGGIPRSRLIGEAEAAGTGLSFVQISDSHIGFHAEANSDTPGTLRDAIALVNAKKGDAALLIHTGDVSHLSRDDQFDTAEQTDQGRRARHAFRAGRARRAARMMAPISSAASPRARSRAAGTASTSRACISSRSTTCRT